MWSVWNKETEINGFSAEYVLSRNQHLVRESTVFIKTVNDRVTQIEGKAILANAFGIDATLPDDEFIREYEVALNPPVEPEEASGEEEQHNESVEA